LLAGNTIVLKPSPFTPFAALLFGQIADELDLPPGVLNIVTGGTEVGRVLTSHDDVDLVTFTCSDSVGAQIMAQAAPTLKRTVMELGGKSALVVREDADVMTAALHAVVGFTGHSGQGCASLSRYIVHNSIRPAFIEAARAIAESLTIGDPADPRVMIGPLIRASQRDKVEHYVRLGHEAGKLVFGGERPSEMRKGFYFRPTLFDAVDNESAIAQEEIFGPVGVTIGFDTDDEAIRLFNRSRYGLAGAIMSADRAAAYLMALKCRTGMLWLNGGYGGDMSSHAPFGGFRRSGLGREYGEGWLDEYLEKKVLSFPIL
jgi:aldehyde dehydrogenase (NAD+)